MRMRESYRRWSAALGATAATSLWWTLWIATAAPIALVISIAVQIVGAVLIATVTGPRRTGLVLALGIAVPAVGPLAALAATVAGRGGGELLHDPHVASRPPDGREIVRSLAGAVPAWEAVVSSDAHMRRTALSNLSRRANASDLEVLRWARTRCGGEIGLEVALAFDEASQGFEQRASLARAAVEEDRGYVAAARAFRILVEGIQSGIVDAPVISRLASEARKYHDAAVAADPVRARELLVARAQLELADRRPAAALDVLRPAIAGGETPGELATVYQQAAYAARRFELAFGLSLGSNVLAG
jgi:hypothetical protein